MINPIYSFVSGRTIQRVWTALQSQPTNNPQEGSDAADPIAAAMACPKNPIVRFISACCRHFGFTDFYAEQQQAKAEFAMALVKALAKADFRQPFVIKDARGNQRHCELQETAGVVRLVELSRNVNTINDLIDTFEPTGNMSANTGGDFAPCSDEIVSCANDMWNNVKAEAVKAQTEIEAVENRFVSKPVQYVVNQYVVKTNRLSYSVIANRILNKLATVTDTNEYAIDDLRQVAKIAEGVSAKTKVPENLQRMIEKIISNVALYKTEVESVAFLAEHVVLHAQSYDVKFVKESVTFIRKNLSNFSSQNIKNIVDAIERVNPYDPAGVAACIVQNSKYFSQKMNSVRDAVNYIINNYTAYDETIINRALTHQGVNHQLIVNKAKYAIADIERNSDSAQWAVLYVVQNPANFAPVEIMKSVKFIANNLENFSERAINQAVKIDKTGVIVTKMKGVLRDVSPAAEKNNKLIQLAASFIAANQKLAGLKSGSDEIKGLVNYVAGNPSNFSHATVASAAQIVVRENRSFFAASVDDRKGFRHCFFENKKLTILKDYERGMPANTDPLQEKYFFMSWNRNGNRWEFSWREDDLQFSKVFFSDNKKRQSYFRKTDSIQLTAFSSWAQGDFEVVLHADREIAEYILENRNHPAIQFWNSQQEIKKVACDNDIQVVSPSLQIDTSKDVQKIRAEDI